MGKHEHSHTHGPVTHSHEHTHDDQHHGHSHPGIAPGTKHSHEHTHDDVSTRTTTITTSITTTITEPSVAPADASRTRAPSGPSLADSRPERRGSPERWPDAVTMHPAGGQLPYSLARRPRRSGDGAPDAERMRSRLAAPDRGLLRRRDLDARRRAAGAPPRRRRRIPRPRGPRGSSRTRTITPTRTTSTTITGARPRPPRGPSSRRRPRRRHHHHHEQPTRRSRAERRRLRRWTWHSHATRPFHRAVASRATRVAPPRPVTRLAPRAARRSGSPPRRFRAAPAALRPSARADHTPRSFTSRATIRGASRPCCARPGGVFHATEAQYGLPRGGGAVLRRRRGAGRGRATPAGARGRGRGAGRDTPGGAGGRGAATDVGRVVARDERAGTSGSVRTRPSSRS